MKVISIVNNKGGCSKSTTSYQLSSTLAQKNNRVLMADNDPQSSLTIYNGIEPLTLSRTMYDVMTDKCNINDAIIKTDNPNISILPSSIDLSAGEIEVIGRFARETILREKLSMINEEFDYVVIDNSPSLGILTINSLVASDYVIAPAEPSYLALRGMEILIDTIKNVKRINAKLELMGVLVSLFDGRIKHHQEILEEFRKRYPVFKSVIKRSSKFSYACVACQSIEEYAGKWFEGAISYRELCEEVLNYGK